MIRKILIAIAGIAVIIGAFAVFVALQPAEFRIERTATIAAPAPEVFAQVNDLHNWRAWSPWAKLDPQAKVTFEGAPAGQGAVFNWSGNDDVGEGSMTLAESRPNELIRIQVAFVRPFEGGNVSEFAFKPDGAQTAVTWTMSGRNGFIGKAMCLFVDMDKMLGGDMEKGLAQMKAVTEAKAGS
ncbi:MAG TPA: SRPBCC family protein [Dongiaceae bacterium]